MKILLSFVLAAFVLVAADTNVTGKWSGSFNMTGGNGESKESTAVLILKQNGTELTGTVGPNEGEQFPIVKGKMEGDKITLEVDHEGMIVKFTLALTQGHIKGDASMSHDGESRTAKIDLTRAN
jgi:hypothetical protein